MRPISHKPAIALCVLGTLACGVIRYAAAQESADVVLPQGVKAVWDLDKAYREATPTRGRVCINGLWRWQPVVAAQAASTGAATSADAEPDRVPPDGWGYFKVPGCWPGITDYLEKDCQTVYAHPSWQDQRLADVTAAWYQREITVPKEWTGRRVVLQAAYVNSLATVYVDGTKVGVIRFPAGEVDLTTTCPPGGKHLLSIHVQALPLQAVMLSYADTIATRVVRGRVARRGLCGDVYLIGEPGQERIGHVRLDTSVRNSTITFNTELQDLTPGRRYSLRATITEDGRPVTALSGRPFSAGELAEGQFAFTADWKPEKLWDIHTPQNQYEFGLSLLADDGTVLDTSVPERFGFREFWINGRDFYLNGSRIFLSAVQYNNAQMGAAMANYDTERESMRRLQSFGINFIYGGNYGCEPGTHLSFEEELRAADDAGMLVALSQPHFGRYNWNAPDAEETNGYAQHAEFYVRVAGNHPSVVFYSTSHNSAGYAEDMNPDTIDGIVDPHDMRPNGNAARALRAQAIIEKLDPGRIVYHHSSGNLGSMHTVNFYTNWTPIQEMSDWFGHWATAGVKPVFTCEYAVPGCIDWAMYRGWYKGKREFGNGVFPWELCLAEWNSQFLGDQAHKISEAEKTNLRWEAQKFRAGELWHRWDYPYRLTSKEILERFPVYAMYITDNWRAFRTWGMSANSPWEYAIYWRLRSGVDKARRDFTVDWENLQRPGLSPDYIAERYERMDAAYSPEDWIATEASRALMRNNQPLLAYVGGKAEVFTSKDHNFLPGETVEKQLIVINNSRETVTCDCAWLLGLPDAVGGTKTFALPTGEQERLPLTFALPENLAPGQYAITATVKFSNGETQEDTFSINVLPRPRTLPAGGRVALFDAKGETARLLDALGVQYEAVDANADLSAYDTLIVGKGALTPDGAAPDVARVRDGLKVIVFEQTVDVLEKRFGFRQAEYGLRQIFKRVPDHPILDGLTEDELRDWRGEATILPPRLKYEISRQFGTATIRWCDIPVTHVWRCGNRGDVASALIEKPAAGDFLPILDGGYSLQYTSLMEYREGRGMVLFCQTDVTGRTESDPAAEALVRNMLRYVADWKPVPRRAAVYTGDEGGEKYLETTGLSPAAYAGGALTPDQVLVVGPGGGQRLAGNAAAVADFLKAGGSILCLGLDDQEANAFLPVRIATKKAEHIAAFFEAPGKGSLLAGVSPADVHNRDPRELPLVSSGATVIGDGVLAQGENGNVVFCQMLPWQFDVGTWNTKRTFRRSSCLVTRLLANMGASAPTPLLDRLHSPVKEDEKRWLSGFYLDTPEEWDYPYRFFRW
jgi:beta-galactosidase